MNQQAQAFGVALHHFNKKDSSSLLTSLSRSISLKGLPIVAGVSCGLHGCGRRLKRQPQQRRRGSGAGPAFPPGSLQGGAALTSSFCAVRSRVPGSRRASRAEAALFQEPDATATAAAPSPALATFAPLEPVLLALAPVPSIGGAGPTRRTSAGFAVIVVLAMPSAGHEGPTPAAASGGCGRRWLASASLLASSGRTLPCSTSGASTDRSAWRWAAAAARLMRLATRGSSPYSNCTSSLSLSCILDSNQIDPIRASLSPLKVLSVLGLRLSSLSRSASAPWMRRQSEGEAATLSSMCRKVTANASSPSLASWTTSLRASGGTAAHSECVTRLSATPMAPSAHAPEEAAAVAPPPVTARARLRSPPNIHRDRGDESRRPARRARAVAVPGARASS
mmetsp:Transcript_88766/g.250019  ORF Transcript_88766/g.250019 Transcript_88766/m.250019 type:complete len:394 (+) Transcript_88766:46-1227(+)